MASRFVGAVHGALVSELLDCYKQVERGRSVLFELRGPVGVGKTRVLHEFYATLSATQTKPLYWPPRIAAGTPGTADRKLVQPAGPEPSGTKPEWIWWGTRCRPDAPYAGQLEVTRLVQPLVDLAESSPRSFVSSDEALAGLGLLGLVVLPVGVAASVSSAVKALWNRARGQATARASTVEALRGRSPDSEAILIAEALTSLSRMLPVVLAVEDAHWSDEILAQVVQEVLQQDDSRVLVVATAVDDGIGGSSWERHAAASPAERRRHAMVPALTAQDVEALILEVAPLTPPDVIAAIGRRAQGNPLALRLLLDVEVLRGRIWHGAIHLTASEVDSLPDRHSEQYAAYWEALPPSARVWCSIASVAGESFVIDDVVAAERRLAITTEQALTDQLSQQLWIRSAGESIAEFNDPAQFATARGRRAEVLRGDDVHTLALELSNRTVERNEAEDPASLDPTFGEVAWRSHIALFQEHSGVDVYGAGVSAQRLIGVLLDQLRKSESLAVIKAMSETIHRRSPGDISAMLVVRSWFAIELRNHGLLAEAFDELTSIWSVVTAEPQRKWEVVALDVSIADVLSQLQRPTAAVELLREAEARLETLRDAPCPSFIDPVETQLKLKNNLAFWLGELGDFGEAASRFEELEDMASELCGATAEFTFDVRLRRIQVANKSGDPKAALLLLSGLRTDVERYLGKDSSQALQARNEMGMALLGKGDLTEARDLFEALVNDWRDRSPALGPSSAQINLATVHCRLGDHAVAAREYRAMVSDALDSLEPAASSTLEAWEKYAIELCHLKRPDLARSELSGLERILTGRMADNERTLLRVKLHLAACDSMLGRSAAAAVALASLAEEVEARFGAEDVLTRAVRYEYHRAVYDVITSG